MKTLAVSAIMLGISMVLLKALSNDDIQKWTAIVDAKEVPEIAQIVEHSAPDAWPKLISDASANLNAPADPKPSGLGLALLGRIRTYEKNTPTDAANTIRAAAAYGALSRGLKKSGGYINLCLANAVDILAIARLSDLLVNDPTSVDKVKAEFDDLACIPFERDNFVQMIYDEPAQKLQSTIDKKSLDDRTAEAQILKALNTTDDDAFFGFALSKTKGTSFLIQELQISVLFERIVVVDVQLNVSLAGLIEFYKRGGRESDLNSHDVRPFLAIMKGSENRYKSHLIGVNRVGVGELLLYIKEFKTSSKSNRLATMALE